MSGVEQLIITDLCDKGKQHIWYVVVRFNGVTGTKSTLVVKEFSVCFMRMIKGYKFRVVYPPALN